MNELVKLHVPNSLILVVSSHHPEIPDIDDGSLVSSTSTCLAIGTIAEDDGEATVELTDEAVDGGRMSLVCEASLDGSEGFVAVRTVLGDIVIHQTTNSATIELGVWVSHPHEPEYIVIQTRG